MATAGRQDEKRQRTSAGRKALDCLRPLDIDCVFAQSTRRTKSNVCSWSSSVFRAVVGNGEERGVVLGHRRGWVAHGVFEQNVTWRRGQGFDLRTRAGKTNLNWRPHDGMDGIWSPWRPTCWMGVSVSVLCV